MAELHRDSFLTRLCRSSINQLSQQAQLTDAQSSHLHPPPSVAGYDHSHLPVPQLHPSLAGLVPQQQQQQQRPAAPPPPPPPSHYQQAAAQVAAANANANANANASANASGSGQHRDIPVDPVLLGLLPNPPAHFTTSSVRSGGGEGGSAGARSSEQDRQRQAVAAAAAAALAVAGLARGGGGGGGGAPAVTDGGGSRSGSSGGKKRKDKGMEKERARADNNIQVVAGTDQTAAAAVGAGTDSTSSQQQQQPLPSGTVQEQKESLHDLYSHVDRILGPNHKRHNNNDPYTGRKVPSHGSNANRSANGTIGAEGVEKAQGGFYEQLRSKWMSTKDLRQLSEQYGKPPLFPFRVAQVLPKED